MSLSFASKTLVVAAMFSLVLLNAPVAQLQTTTNYAGSNLDETCIKSGLCTSATVGKDKEGARTNLAKLIGNIINTILSITGVLFLFFIISGGQMWVTAGGNNEKVMEARSIMLNAAYGMLAVGIAYITVDFLLDFLVKIVTTNNQ